MTPELQEEIAAVLAFQLTGNQNAWPVLPEARRSLFINDARAIAPIIARLIAAERDACAAMCEDRFAMNGWAVVAAIRARQPRP